MVKFDDKGQGYWEFVLLNCSDVAIRAIHEDIEKGYEILLVNDEAEVFFTVILTNDVKSHYVVHTDFKGKYIDHKRRDFFYRDIALLREGGFLNV